MNIVESSENTVSTLTQGGTAVIVSMFFREAIARMIPYLLAAAVLIVVDLYFGVAASKKRNETIRFSRMVRRTMGKTFEYICWCTLSASLSVAFNFPSLQYLILGIIAGNEIISILTNWGYLHGKKVKGLNIFKIFGNKAGIDMDDITIEEDNKDGKRLD